MASSLKNMTSRMEGKAQKLLANRQFGRARRTFGWDWHFWNFLLCTAPVGLWWLYLEHLNKKLIEKRTAEEQIREATGVGVKGFAIPQKHLEEATNKALSKNRPPTEEELAELRKLAARAQADRLGGAQENGVLAANAAASDRSIKLLRALHQRMSDIERKLGVEASSEDVDDLLKYLAGQDVIAEEKPKQDVADQPQAKNEEAASVPSIPSVVMAKAGKHARAAGAWVVEAGQEGGMRLLHWGQQMLAGREEPEMTPRQASDRMPTAEEQQSREEGDANLRHSAAKHDEGSDARVGQLAGDRKAPPQPHQRNPNNPSGS